MMPGQRWIRHSVQEWDRQYSSAAWTYLAGLEQTPRYAIIEAWRRRLKPSGSVLDLGCGEGVLFAQIPSDAGVHYTGVDVSEVAVNTALNKVVTPLHERFICADLVTFASSIESPVDVIVCNEVLYYLKDPVDVLRRYCQALKPGGIVIVSVFHEEVRTWKDVDRSMAHARLQTVLVRDFSSGKAWYLGLYQPARMAE